MSRQKIMMPVIALFESCNDCPELDIGVARKETEFNIEDKGYYAQVCENTLYCKHYEKCRKICTNILKGEEERNSDDRK